MQRPRGASRTAGSRSCCIARSSRMKRLVGWLGSRWSISFAGTALLAGLAWVFGPLLPSFEDWAVRLALVLAIVLTWGAANVLLDLRGSRRETALAAGLTTNVA